MEAGDLAGMQASCDVVHFDPVHRDPAWVDISSGRQRRDFLSYVVGAPDMPQVGPGPGILQHHHIANTCLSPVLSFIERRSRIPSPGVAVALWSDMYDQPALWPDLLSHCPCGLRSTALPMRPCLVVAAKAVIQVT